MNEGKTCLVLGVGPATGSAVAQRFAQAGYNLAIASRSDKNLAAAADLVRKTGVRVLVIKTDAANEAAVTRLVAQAETELGPIEVAVYNASGRVIKSVLELTGAEVESAWRTACLGGLFFGREAAKRMVTRNKGTIIFTGATAGMRGGANFAGFAIGKFGLRALAQSMARELHPQGIHVTWVNIDGIIETPNQDTVITKDKANSMLTPAAIAETYYQIHLQHRSAWSQEVELRPWVERF